MKLSTVADQTMGLKLMTDKQVKKPKVKLIGKNGNVFNLASIVKQALIKNKQPDKAKEFTEKLFKTHSYNDALCLMMEYVDVC